MGAEHQHLIIAIALQKIPARVPCPVHVVIELAGHMRQADLNRMVHHVARYHRALAGGRNHHADISWRMPGRRLEAHLITDLMVNINQFMQTRIDNGLDRILIDSD